MRPDICEKAIMQGANPCPRYKNEEGARLNSLAPPTTG